MSRNFYRETTGGFGDTPITWAVQRLILANIIIFALQLFTAPLLVWLNTRPGFYGGGLAPWLGFQQQAFLQGFVWTPLTYQFMHAGLMHLFVNMLSLFFFGPDVERALGTRGFFRFYLICGAVAVLATLPPYLLRGELTNVVGASGAVMAVLVAFAVLEPDREIVFLPLPWPINARAAVMVVFIMNIVASLGGSSISVLTHFGGMAAGFLYMKTLPMLMNLKREKRRKDAAARKEHADKVGEAVDNIFKFDNRKRH